jgi:hypothetical protein
VLAEGISDEKGKVILSEEQEKLLGECYFKRPGCLWITYQGQTAQLDVMPESPDWSDEDKLLHALSSLSYADEVQGGKRAGSSPSDIVRAAGGHGTESVKKLLDQWKKGD